MTLISNLYLYTAAIYVVICLIYARGRHDRVARSTLATAAFLLAAIAIVRAIEPASSPHPEIPTDGPIIAYLSDTTVQVS